MRRILTNTVVAGAALTLTLGSAACGGDGDDPAPSEPPAAGPSPTIAPPPETGPPGHGWEGAVEIDFGTGEITAPDFNELVDTEQPEWAHDPTSAAEVLLRVDELDGTIEVEAESGGGEPVVVVTNSELFDDSVEAMRYRIVLAEGDDGLYRFASGEASWRCRTDRGQQDFGTEPCA